MTRPERSLLAGLLLWMLLRVSTCAGSAHAQDADALVRTVVQLTAHEAGFDSLDDATGIHAVLVHGGERHGMTPAAFGHAYAPRMYAGTTPRAWARELDVDCERPSGYPLPWYRPRAEGALSRHDACAVLVLHVRELVSGPPRCDADDWSAPWVRLAPWLVATDCGETANLFSRRLR